MTSYAHVQSGWYRVGEKVNFYRSRWEVLLACWCECQKQKGEFLDWQHEPKTFWFEGIRRGCVSYKPDFRIDKADGISFWVEVKGQMDAKSVTKIKRFKKYFPEESLVVLDSNWFKAHLPELSRIEKKIKGVKVMPLKKGTSKSVVSENISDVSENISEMVHSGKPQKVAVAAALSTARKSGAKIKKPKK